MKHLYSDPAFILIICVHVHRAMKSLYIRIYCCISLVFFFFKKMQDINDYEVFELKEITVMLVHIHTHRLSRSR